MKEPNHPILIRLPIKTWRTVQILKSLNEFGTIQKVSLDAINKKIQDVFDNKPEVKKIIDKSLELFQESDKTVIDEL